MGNSLTSRTVVLQSIKIGLLGIITILIGLLLLVIC